MVLYSRRYYFFSLLLLCVGLRAELGNFDRRLFVRIFGKEETITHQNTRRLESYDECYRFVTDFEELIKRDPQADIDKLILRKQVQCLSIFPHLSQDKRNILLSVSRNYINRHYKTLQASQKVRTGITGKPTIPHLDLSVIPPYQSPNPSGRTHKGTQVSNANREKKRYPAPFTQVVAEGIIVVGLTYYLYKHTLGRAQNRQTQFSSS